MRLWISSAFRPKALWCGLTVAAVQPGDALDCVDTTTW
jgi:hypothetical protein